MIKLMMFNKLIIQVTVGSILSAVASAPASEPIPISVENAHRLKLFARKEIPGPAIGLLAADPVCTIEEITADSKQNRLYFYRQSWTDLQGGKECGIYIYDLNGFQQLKYIPIPSIGADGTGKSDWRKRYISCSGWFDLSFDRLLVGIKEGIDVETGASTPIAGLPQKAILPSDPVVDSNTILFRDKLGGGSSGEDKGAFLLDREKLTVIKHLSLPPANKNIVIKGAIDENVLAWTIDQKPSQQLIVFRQAGPVLEILASKELDEKYRPAGTAIDREHHRWAVSEVVDWEDDKKRLRIYEIPSLKLIREFAHHTGSMVFVPSTSLLLVNPAFDRKKLLVINVESGEVLKELKLQAFGMRDRNGAWMPFVDPHGCWIGVYGCTWLQLFRIEP